MNMLLERRRSMLTNKKEVNYVIQCFDKNAKGYNPAASIILNTAGYGSYVNPNDHSKGWYLTEKQASLITTVGTLFKGKVNVTDINGIMSSDTTLQYPFEYLTELTEFSNLTTIPQDAFRTCTNLKYLTIPKTVTSLGGCTYGCTGMIDLLVYSNANAGYISAWCENTNASAVGNGTGIWLLNGSITFNAARWARFKKFYFGSISNMSTGGIISQNTCQEVRLRDNFYSNTTNNNNGYLIAQSFNRAIRFVSIGGTITYTSTSVTHGLFGSNCPSILHLGYDAVANSQLPCEPYRASAGLNALTKIYVGNGSSQQHDQSILSTYLADTDWNNYSSKLGIWWNYNGEYRTYLVQENLTNFTNSNPVEWPYITRNESYNTMIISTNSTPLYRIRAKMYEAVDDDVTPDNPTDITSQVYNASTGEINIPYVTGNVIIEEVPYDAEIEYLESDGSSYITNISADANTRVVIEYELANGFSFGNGSFIFGCHIQNDIVNVYSVAIPNISTIRVPVLTNFTNIGDCNMSYNTAHVIDYKKGEVYFDGVLKSNAYPQFSSGVLRIFGRESGVAGNRTITRKLRVRSFKRYENNILTLDFVPVRVGQIGYMYDKVSGQLFGNSGTGNFVLGPDKS